MMEQISHVKLQYIPHWSRTVDTILSSLSRWKIKTCLKYNIITLVSEEATSIYSL